jgi:LmbE family N-acetylglucosaminyl deacetylase
MSRSEGMERVLVIVAHPDDAESHAGGTVASFVQAGTRVTYVVVTNGEKGSRDRTMTAARLAAIRQDEQRRAAMTLGVSDVEFLGYPDSEVEDSRDLRRDLTRAIRRRRPDLVMVQNPNRTRDLGTSHRDHRIVASAALDCIYPLARDWMTFPELLPEYEPHEVREIYLMHAEHPEVIIDISRTIDLKARALACHVSQVGDDARRVEASVRARGAMAGRAHGLAYAEAFDRILVGR